MNNKGFTLIEVLVSITLIAIIWTMMVTAYISSLKASRDLYLREQTKLTLLEYVDYCANSNFLPSIIENDQILLEKHFIETLNQKMMY